MDSNQWREWVRTLSEAELSERRVDIMILGLQSGCSLREVGNRFGVSRERVRQLVAKQGVKSGDIRAQERAEEKEREHRLARRVREISLLFPEYEVAEIAELFKTSEPVVRKALGARLLVHDPPRAKTVGKGTDDEELLSAIANWAAETDELTGVSYSAWAAQRGIPGMQTVAIRFRSWNEALELAGIENRFDVGGVRPQIPDEAMWAALLDFYREDLPNYSSLGYGQYAQQFGKPSLASIRARLGNWSKVHATVRKLLRYCAAPDGSWELGERVLAFDDESRGRADNNPEVALRDLIAVAKQATGPLTMSFYKASRGNRTRVGTIIRLFGSWVAALQAAGLSHRLSSQARRKK